MSEIITCPTGLTGCIRGMKVREERILADHKLAEAGGQVDELLAACCEETLDPGPYDFWDKVFYWGQVLQGDRLFALHADGPPPDFKVLPLRMEAELVTHLGEAC